MGQHANARAWAEYERQQARKQEEYFEDEAVATEDDLEARYSDWLWDKQDAAPRSVRLWDEGGVGR